MQEQHEHCSCAEAMRGVVDAANQLRDAKKAMMRHGWEAHSDEAAALSSLFQALAALGQAQPEAKEGQ
jgi:hypothetical protein